MDELVKWSTIASPIVAVILAWLTSFFSSRGTKKQLEGLKDIALLQLQTTILMIDIEADKALMNKTEQDDEISKLYHKMHIMRSNENTPEQALNEIELEIEKLSKSSVYQKSMFLKLVENQFRFMKLLDQVAKSN